MTSKSPFGWYERVRVVTRNPALRAINGRLAAVVGRSRSERGRRLWFYAIHVYEPGDETTTTWCCYETELVSTGTFDRRESLFRAGSIRVSQHGEVLDPSRTRKRQGETRRRRGRGP